MIDKKRIGKCKDCMFWNNLLIETYMLSDAGKENILHSGECRRNVPIESRQMFPHTTEDSWCGEFSEIHSEVENSDTKSLRELLLFVVECLDEGETPEFIANNILSNIEMGKVDYVKAD